MGRGEGKGVSRIIGEQVVGYTRRREGRQAETSEDKEDCIIQEHKKQYA